MPHNNKEIAVQYQYPQLCKIVNQIKNDLNVLPIAFNAFGISRIADQDEYVLVILKHAVQEALTIGETLALFAEAYEEVQENPEGDDHEIIRTLCKGRPDYLISKGIFFGEMKEKQFIAVTLEEYDQSPFNFFQEEYQPGNRHIYFVDKTDLGTITQNVMLLGQSLFEFEACPRDALPLTPGLTHRLYFPDKKVLSYSLLSNEEKKETKKRLYQLLLRCSDYVAQINALINLV